MTRPARTLAARTLAARTLAALTLCLPLLAAAAGQTWTLNAQVGSVNPGAPGFPTALAGLAAGDAITATLTYDTVPAPASNTFSGALGVATLYKTTGFSFTLTTPVGTLTSWASPALHAFVWNDDIIFGSPSDGLLFTNGPLFGNPFFQLGNLLLNTGTFASEALPQASVPGLMVLEAGQQIGTTWFAAQGSTLQFSAGVVPEPATALLWLAGLAAVGVAARRRG
jgi:PEP-CTERM motif